MNALFSGINRAQTLGASAIETKLFCEHFDIFFIILG